MTQPWRLCLLTPVVLALSACASIDVEDLRDSAAFHRQATIESRPVTRPVRAVSSFAEPLTCMDRMLRDFEVSKILITSKQIADASGTANVDAKQMVITALSRMSRISGTFRYVDYEIDLLHQDTVQTLTGLLLHSDQLRLQRPGLYVSGAVTYVDKTVLASRQGAGASGSRLDFGWSGNKEASVIALDLNFGEFQTRTFVPGLESANEIVVGSSGRGGDLSARIGRYGVELNLSREAANGYGAAVRTLVELGMIELVGKWAQIPYWRCLRLDDAHPVFQRQVRDWFDAMTEPERHQAAARTLVASGYLAAESTEDGEAFSASLAAFQASENIVASGELDVATYEHLLRVGPKPPAARGKRVVPKVSGASGAGSDLPAPRPVEVTLDFIDRGRSSPVFAEGRQIYLAATLSRTAYLACWYLDSENRISRIFPNPFQPSSLVPGQREIRLPDTMAANQGFAIIGRKPGPESVRCYAGETDLMASLPPIWKGPPIASLGDALGFDRLQDDLAQVRRTGALGSATLGWEVVPKGEPVRPARP